LTTTPSDQSVAETRAMALAMFPDIPCFFELMDPSCPKAALWVVYFAHEEATDCTHDMAWPVCDEHKAAVQRMASAFWRMWLQAPPVPCDKCGTPIRLDRVEAIR
jgi:hypothetical protein